MLRPTAVQVGSSPLTRGKLFPPVTPSRRRRLIPAHAGKMSGCPSRRPGGRAHPRSRGENVGDGASSTPSPAHPRSRGENSAAFGWINGSLGSSPLTRGKYYLTLPARPVNGLIPAHAGKIPPRPRRSSRQRAHPRSRGENAVLGATGTGADGSSPLTRGKWLLGRRIRGVQRLIPAHAGKILVGAPGR